MNFQTINKIAKKTFSGVTIPLIELCNAISDCPHYTPNWTKSGKLVIRNYNIKKGNLDLSNRYYTDEETYKNRISRQVPEPGDLIITREAPMGEVCMIPEGIECCLGQRMVLIKPDPKKVNNRFLLYSLLSEYVHKQIKQSDTSGSIVSNLCIPDLEQLRIPVVSLKEQDRIAHILCPIDDKISLNNRINAELEQMAKTIYNYWFVQFEFPNEDGKPYKSSGGEMVWNEELKREVPRGWEVGKLGDVANILMGQSPSGESYNETGDGIVFFQGSTDFSFRFPEVRMYTTEPSRIANEGDVLLSVRAPVGTLNVANQRCCIGRGLGALNSKNEANSYMLYLMFYFKTMFDIQNRTGTTFGSIDKDTLHGLQFPKPPMELQKKFQSVVGEYDKMISIRSLENQELTRLRDFLLPLLMNGQVRVGEGK